MYLMQSPLGAKTMINGRDVDYFCGTGYYCLQGHVGLIDAACNAMRLYGINSGTSRAGFGNNTVLLDVEQKAARFFGAESALYYVSGYLGNAILLQGLAPDYDVIFVDEESHYSILDGASTVDKPMVTFAHADSDDLRLKLSRYLTSGQRPLVISDGVFPTSGEIAPLAVYDTILSDYPDSILCVDDAHAYMVIGETGRGSLEYCGVQGERRYSCGTLSKAAGGHGGIITGSAALIEQLKRYSKIPAGASSVPVPAAAASAAGLAILQQQPELRRQLWANVAYAKKAFRELGFEGIPDTPVPIICLSAHSSGLRLDLALIQQQLFAKGIAVLYVPGGSYTSVPKSGALRIAIFSTHSREQIDRMVGQIGSML